MNVRWKLPDGTFRDQAIPDMEQLMFLLRMAGGVEIEGALYRVAGSTLVVESDSLSVAVDLETAQALNRSLEDGS